MTPDAVVGILYRRVPQLGQQPSARRWSRVLLLSTPLILTDNIYGWRWGSIESDVMMPIVIVPEDDTSVRVTATRDMDMVLYALTSK